jgi:hypothetical protein
MGVARGRKQKIDDAGLADDASNLTPNPFPSGKGNRNVGFPSGKGTKIRSGCVGVI